MGLGDTAGTFGVTVAPGSEAALLVVGEGLVQGTYYMVGGALDEFGVTQPVVADFERTRDGAPAVKLKVRVRLGPSPGSRNVLVLNTAGEVAAFVGGLRVTEWASYSTRICW